jgi:hypothetical protein
MVSIPPVPPFPQLPYPLPFGYEIDPSHILQIPEDENFCFSCVMNWLDCLIVEPVGREGCDWVINVNNKIFYLKWRDISPRSPWTRQVWDIFQVLPDVCGCPSQPRGLGWQWCWADVIRTIKCEVQRQWQNGDIYGSKQTVVAIGTNAFQPGTPGIEQVGPVLYLDATDSSSITSAGGSVSEWKDKSTFDNHARQSVVALQPTIDAAALNGLDTIRFDASMAQWMDILLKARADWHMFIVGRFLANVPEPKGTFMGAMGNDGSFGGIEGKVYQDAGAGPLGTPFSFINTNEVPMVGTSLASGTYGIWEFSETISGTGKIRIGVNAFDQQVFSGNTSEDYWDPTRETFGEPIPLPASIGRSNWGINPSRTFDYLDGNIGELLLYPRVLAEGERVQVLNVLRAKWALGSPLPFPPSPPPPY